MLKTLTQTPIKTPLGDMIAVANDEALVLLEFTDRKNIERQMAKLPAAPKEGENAILQQIREELAAYFDGRLQRFKTPYRLGGTDFQHSVWNALLSLKSGKTCSYGQIANDIENPKAVRGAAAAVGANQLAILIPCHRVIGKDGSLTGYAGGLERKKWLLAHEQRLEN